MAETLSLQLDRVQTAIAAIENGAQSYTINGRTYNRPDLNTLYAREKRLLRLIDKASSGDSRVAEF